MYLQRAGRRTLISPAVQRSLPLRPARLPHSAYFAYSAHSAHTAAHTATPRVQGRLLLDPPLFSPNCRYHRILQQCGPAALSRGIDRYLHSATNRLAYTAATAPLITTPTTTPTPTLTPHARLVAAAAAAATDKAALCRCHCSTLPRHWQQQQQRQHEQHQQRGGARLPTSHIYLRLTPASLPTIVTRAAAAAHFSTAADSNGHGHGHGHGQGRSSSATQQTRAASSSSPASLHPPDADAAAHAAHAAQAHAVLSPPSNVRSVPAVRGSESETAAAVLSSSRHLFPLCPPSWRLLTLSCLRLLSRPLFLPPLPGRLPLRLLCRPTLRRLLPPRC